MLIFLLSINCLPVGAFAADGGEVIIINFDNPDNIDEADSDSEKEKADGMEEPEENDNENSHGEENEEPDEDDEANSDSDEDISESDENDNVETEEGEGREEESEFPEEEIQGNGESGNNIENNEDNETYLHDENGNIVYDINGNPAYINEYGQTFAFNMNGYRYLVNIEGWPVLNEHDFYIFIDENGETLLEIPYFNENGETIHDEEGNLIFINSKGQCLAFDEDGNRYLVNPDGSIILNASGLRIYIDELGELIENPHSENNILLDENGNPFIDAEGSLIYIGENGQLYAINSNGLKYLVDMDIEGYIIFNEYGQKIFVDEDGEILLEILYFNANGEQMQDEENSLIFINYKGQLFAYSYRGMRYLVDADGTIILNDDAYKTFVDAEGNILLTNEYGDILLLDENGEQMQDTNENLMFIDPYGNIFAFMKGTQIRYLVDGDGNPLVQEDGRYYFIDEYGQPLVSGIRATSLTLSGSGTELDPYLIGNLTDFLQFVSNVGTVPYDTAHYKLTSSIDAAVTIEPISYFNGVLDGNNHTISRLNIYNNTSGQIDIGLFRTLNGTIKNTNFSDLKVSGERGTMNNSNGNIGGIAGTVSNKGAIVDCKLSETKLASSPFSYNDNSGTYNVGTVAGKSSGTISGCAATGSESMRFSVTTANSSTTTLNLGGIVGSGNVDKSYTTVYVQGNITTGSNSYVTLKAAGISADGNAQNCFSTNEIYAQVSPQWISGDGEGGGAYYEFANSVSVTASGVNIGTSTYNSFSTARVRAYANIGSKSNLINLLAGGLNPAGTAYYSYSRNSFVTQYATENNITTGTGTVYNVARYTTSCYDIGTSTGSNVSKYTGYRAMDNMLDFGFNNWTPRADDTEYSYFPQVRYWQGTEDSLIATRIPNNAPAYRVSFDTDGGTSCSSISVKTGMDYGTLPTTTKAGHDFLYWVDSENNIITSSTIVTRDSAHTLTAVWRVKTFNITFDGDGGTLNFDSNTVTWGQIYGTLPIATKIGFNHTGWQDADNNIITADTIVNIDDDIILYATYEGVDVVITFDTKGGDNLEPKTVKYQELYGVLPIAMKTGHTFRRWIDGSDNIITAEDTVNYYSDFTLYAEYYQNPYTVSFDTDGGTALNSITVTFDNPYGTLPEPTKENYIFSHFEDEYGNIIDENTIVSIPKNHTVKAIYKGIDVTVYYDFGVGMAIQPYFKTVEFGSKYGDLPTPTAANFVLLGWVDDEGNEITADSIVKIPTTHYIHAEFEGKEIVVSFDSSFKNSHGENYSGGTFNNKAVKYMAPYGALPEPSIDGYSFEGWQLKISNTTVLAINENTIVEALTIDHELTADYKPEQYEISFDTKGGNNVEAITVTFDEAYGTLPEPVRTGYKFLHYVDSEGNIITAETIVKIPNNDVLTAVWEAKEYKVSFDTAGGNTIEAITVTYDSVYGVLPEPIRTGYKFLHYVDSEGNIITADSIVKIADNQTLTAVWEAKEYKVSFDTAGGNTIDAIKVTYDSVYGALPEPIRTGYKFLHYVDSEGNIITAETIVKIPNNHVLTAVWEAKEYTVSFNSDGGNTIDSKTVIFDSVYGDLPVAEKTGYTFSHWKDAEGNKINADTKVKIADNHELTAEYTPNIYEISFNTDGGEYIAEIEVTFGTAYGTLPIAKKAGYTFSHWVDENNKKVTADMIVNVALNQEFTAIYTVNTYEVSFNSNGGNTIDAISVTFDEVYGTLPEPTKDGAVFKGWYLDSEFITEVTADTIVKTADNHTLYAKWVDALTITFMVNDGTPTVYTTLIIGKGDIAVLPEPSPERKGFIFKGWTDNTVSETEYIPDILTESLILFAVWEHDGFTEIHNVNFMWNDGSFRTYLTLQVGRDGLMNRPEEPVRKGYDFLGWYLDKEGTEEHSFSDAVIDDIFLYAKWRQNSAEIKEYYTVHFNWNDGTFRQYTEIEVIENDKVPVPVNPIRPGYDLLGWYLDAEGIIEYNFLDAVTEDITLYAKWERTSGTNEEDFLKVNFMYNDGSFWPYTQVEVFTGNPVMQPIAPERNGYDFLGWFMDSEGNYPYDFTNLVTEDLTLYAKWEQNSVDTSKYYTVYFNWNDGTFRQYTEIEVIENSSVRVPVAPERAGYNFIGWHLDAEGTTEYNFLNGVTENIILYAKWEMNEIGNKEYFTVSFMWNDGSFRTYTTVEVIENSLVPVPKVPERLGFNFLGWYLNSEGTTEYDFSDAITSDMLLYALWEKDNPEGKNIYYTVKFLMNNSAALDAEYTEIEVLENDVVPVPVDPKLTGFNFLGWFMDSQGNNSYDFTKPVIEDFNLYAKWYDLNPSKPDENGSGNTGSNSGGYIKQQEITPAYVALTEDESSVNRYGLNCAYIEGYPDGTFRPNNGVTRAEVAMMIYKLFYDGSSYQYSNIYPDVENDKWYTQAVHYLTDKNIMIGYDDGFFRPEQNITRAEITVIVSKLKGMIDGNAPFADIDGHWAFDYINSAYGHDVIEGYPDGSFKPDFDLTRAETVVIINAVIGRDKCAEVHENIFTDIDGHWAYNSILCAATAH